MSAHLRDRPKWASNALIEAETKMLSRLEASAAMMRMILQASAVNTQEMFEEHFECKGEAAPQLGPTTQALTQEVLGLKPKVASVESAPAPVAEAPMKPKKPRAKRPYFPRIHAPQMLALGQRAAELLIELAPIIRQKTNALINAGIDPRSTLRRASSMQIAHVFLDELGIDLEHIERASFEQMLSALKEVQEWITQCRRSEAVYFKGASSSEQGAAATGPPANAAEPAFPDAPPPVEPAPQDEKARSGREPELYSAGKDSLDWTKL